MSEVSIIGLGAMGSALVRAFLKDEHQVTVWNRTITKAEPLVRGGAALANDPASAIDASPVVVISVSDYEATRDILLAPEVSSKLSGRVLVQLTGGTPQEARDMQRWAQDSKALYLDGTIMSYANQMGTQEAGIMVAGAEAAFQRHESLLRSLAGNFSYLGEQVGMAKAIGLATGSVLFGALLSTLHGIRICEAEGLNIEEFGSMLTEFMPTVGEAAKDLCERAQEERFDESQATLRTGADGAEFLLQQAHDSQINTDFPAYAAGTFRKGMDAGLGSEDMGALIKVLRGGT